MIASDVDGEFASRMYPQCVQLAGPDARAFAQAQFSADIGELHAGHWQWNAWLSPKGAVRALMHLADRGDGTLLALLRGGEAPALCDAWRPYVLRAKVHLGPREGFVQTGGGALPLGQFALEGDAVAFGCGDYSIRLVADGADAGEVAGRALRLAAIRAGWPSLPPGALENFLPPALGLEHLQAVSFQKGCYPGQEIAARLHYLGGHKRRLHHLGAHIPPVIGSPLSPTLPRSFVLDSVEIGDQWEALAVMDEADSGNCEAAGITLIKRFPA